jgi:uncharacterized membrane protein
MTERRTFKIFMLLLATVAAGLLAGLALLFAGYPDLAMSTVMGALGVLICCLIALVAAIVWELR